ncbi:MAG: hypothetical protein AAF667_17285 [Pseudomonadota bacterium]
MLRILIALALALFIPACQPTGESESAGTGPASIADPNLVSRADAMSRTILEATLIGGAVGGGFNVILGEDTGSGISIGALAGATAGTYVALVQQRHVTRRARLRAIQTDLDANAAEISATIAEMERVLAERRALIENAGALSPDARETEDRTALANLAEMQRAVAGAEGRASEFGETRQLVIERDNTSEIDPALTDLSNRIAAMRSIANDMAETLVVEETAAL